jgi:hypothetical protein
MNVSRFRRVAGAATLTGALLATPATAQQSRTEAIEQAQAEKAKVLAPYTPSTAEYVLDQIETRAWLDPNFLHGFYPTFASIYPGGGFTLGGGYRKYTGYYSHVDVRGSWSLANFKQVEVSAAAPRIANGMVDLRARAGWRDATQIPFFGLGPTTGDGDRTNARINETYVEGSALVRPTRRLFIRGAASFEDYTEKSGEGTFPSVEERFDASTAPRLGENPRFVHVQGQFGADWLDSPFYSRSGGLYRYSFNQYISQGDGDNFGLVRTDLVQHLPILRETWVISLRGRTESVVGGVAPYFFTPYLGDGNTLRGYSTARFRDRHTAMGSAELRWFPNRLGLDLALFYDAGTVAPEFRSLAWRELKSDYGFGVRFHTPGATVLRLDLARGDEGWRFVFATSAPF